MKPRLFHNRMSFSSQIARLAAVNYGIDYAGVEIDIGPANENYDPRYVAVNPAGVVPTLIDGGRVVTDCIQIARHFREESLGAGVTSSDRDEVWVARQQAIAERELSYASATGLSGFLARRSVGPRIRKLRAMARSFPELAPSYEAKAADFEHWNCFLQDESNRDALIIKTRETLADLDSHLSESRFISGKERGIADIVWTVFLARVEFLHLEGELGINDRANLNRWYRAEKQRPEFEDADIRTSLPGSFVRRIIWNKAGRTVVTLVIAGMAFWVGTAVG